MRFSHLFAVLTYGIATAVFAQQAVKLPEDIIRIPNKDGWFTVELETTVFRPPEGAPGIKKPLVIINHGKAFGNPRFQSRYRPMPAVRFFLQRGYVVAVPMRAGFSNSGGNYIETGCDIKGNGDIQAEDVAAVLKFFKNDATINPQQILIVGQSHGGLTTLAFGARPEANTQNGVKGLVNFAGGLKLNNCPSWETILAKSFGDYAKTTALPSLWFYGDNDSYFSRSTWQDMFERYQNKGGKAKLVAYGTFGKDSHSLFVTQSGEGIWRDELISFMQSIELPTTILYPEFAAATPLSIPPSTNFAPLAAIDAVPYQKEKGREAYAKFLQQEPPRAFAISNDGGWGWANGGDDPLRRALEFCKTKSKAPCHLYAVDTDIVWYPSN